MKRRMKQAYEKDAQKRRMKKALSLGALGVPWRAQGNFLRFVENWTSNSEPMCLMYCAGAQNLASRNSFQADPPHPDNPPEVAYGPQLATPLPHAGGQDDVSSKETPSN